MIKKTLAAHKLGENGFKPTPAGSYFAAHDHHNETLKVVEDAINQSGVNVSKKRHNTCRVNAKFCQLVFKLMRISSLIQTRANTILMDQRICTMLECL
jgi:hypothetical protein